MEWNIATLLNTEAAYFTVCFQKFMSNSEGWIERTKNGGMRSVKELLRAVQAGRGGSGESEQCRWRGTG